jgi:hypothetical protein
VNQRKWKQAPFRTKNAVSDKLFSAAMDWSVASASHASNGQIAAGLPPKTLLEKASTW